MAYGIKVARKGHNARTAHTRHLTLTSEVPNHKTFIEKHDTCTLNCDNGYWYKETIEHNLGYYPMFFIYAKDEATGKWFSPKGGTSEDLYLVGMQVTTNLIRLHIMFTLPMDLGSACSPCPVITDPPFNYPSADIEVEYKYVLTVDPFYKP